MKVVQAFNVHRSGGGATIATIALIDLLRSRGVQVEMFQRSSRDLPQNVLGHLQAGLGVFVPGKTVRQFAEILDRVEPDLVHSHEVFPLISPWILPECRKRGIPVVMTCNDYHLTCPARNHFRDDMICTQCVDRGVLPSVVHNCRGKYAESAVMAAYCTMVNAFRLYLDNVDHFIVPSQFTGEWLGKHAGISSNRLTAVATQVAIPEHACNPAEGTYAAFAGRFVREKGIGVLLEAGELSGVPVRLSRNRVSFVEINLPSKADVLVTDTPNELQTFYRHARMLVVPSVWFETFGLAAAEAMALGIPVIASRIGALAELIEDGVDGLLFTPGSSIELASKMKLLWDDPDLCRELGARARQKAMRLWSPEQHFDRTMAVYRSVLAKAHAVHTASA